MAKMLLPGGLKMATLAKAVGKVTPVQFQILFVLLDNADRETGLSVMPHDDIAARVGCRKRAAQEATRRFEELGFVEVERKQIGRRADGSPVYGGEGGANRYRMLAGRTSAATPTRECSSEHLRALEENKENVPKNVDTLSLNSSLKNLPYGAKEESDPTVVWSAVKKRMAAAYGADVVESWYEKLQFVGIEGEIVTLKAPSSFIRRQIEQHHHDRLLRAWRTKQSNIRELRIDCAV